MRLFRKEVFFSVFFVVLVFSLTAGKAVAQENVHANLYGIVIADSTMKPLADVEVRILGLDRVATTDELGLFSFDMLEPGPYTVVVNVPEFQPWSRDIEVTNEGKELRIVLKREEE